MTDPIRFLPLPYDVVEAFDGPELLLALELYRRAHALRWQWFNVTERQLCARYAMGNRRLWTCLEHLSDLGLLTVDRGSKRRPTRLLVTCPTRELSPTGAAYEQQKRSITTAKPQHNEQQNEAGLRGSLGDLDSKIDSKTAAYEQQKRSTGRSTLTRDKKETLDETENTARERDAVPRWFRVWLSRDGRELRGRVKAPEALAAVARCVSAIRPREVEADRLVESAARPVLRLWRELLVEGEAESLDALVDVVEVLADACRNCPDPLFARDVRGEGWENARDRSQNVAAVCRLSPPPTSQGATWQERLAAARDWNRRGRPGRVLEHPSRTTGDGYLGRLNAIAQEGA
jgi:hypothetical protein